MRVQQGHSTSIHKDPFDRHVESLLREAPIDGRSTLVTSDRKLARARRGLPVVSADRLAPAAQPTRRRASSARAASARKRERLSATASISSSRPSSMVMLTRCILPGSVTETSVIATVDASRLAATASRGVGSGKWIAVGDHQGHVARQRLVRAEHGFVEGGCRR